MLDIFANHPDRLILTAEADARAALAAQQAASDQGNNSDDTHDAFYDRVRAADGVVFATAPKTCAGAAAVLRRILDPEFGFEAPTPLTRAWEGGLRNVLALLEAFGSHSSFAPVPPPSDREGEAEAEDVA